MRLIAELSLNCYKINLNWFDKILCKKPQQYFFKFQKPKNTINIFFCLNFIFERKATQFASSSFLSKFQLGIRKTYILQIEKVNKIQQMVNNNKKIKLKLLIKN